MTPAVPDPVLQALAQVASMSRWERSELGRELRRHGWTYSEIGAIIPAAKSTIAGWCRNIDLTPQQVKAIRSRTGSQRGIPRDTQQRRRLEIQSLRKSAHDSFRLHRNDSFWSLGIALYWGEGAKVKRELSLTNSDPAIHLLFHKWVSRYLIAQPDVVLHLHLHEGNDETAAREWWSKELGLEYPDFDKTHVKPIRPGRRKNNLQRGVARSRMRQSTDAWITTIAWIDELRLDARASG
jgi:hypothetical protein